MIKTTAQARNAKLPQGAKDVWLKTTTRGLTVRVKKEKNFWYVRKMIKGQTFAAEWDIDEYTFDQATAEFHKIVAGFKDGIDVQSHKIEKDREQKQAAETISKTFKKYTEAWVADKADKVKESQKKSDAIMIKKCEQFWDRHPGQIKRAEFAEFLSNIKRRRAKRQSAYAAASPIFTVIWSIRDLSSITPSLKSAAINLARECFDCRI